MKEVQLKWIKGKVFKISLLMRYNFSLEKIKGMKTGLFRRFIDTLSFSLEINQRNENRIVSEIYNGEC